VIEHSFPDRPAYRAWLVEEGFRDCVPDEKARHHSSSPFVWASKEATEMPNPADVTSYLGGHDDTLSWARNFANPSIAVQDSIIREAYMVDDGYSPDHPYDYDFLVIGGGSGGMAAAKEASRLGAKVACLDFVKPSPVGTTWGLGGTCVNVGCIPKKLMHTGALFQQALQSDLEAFGILKPEDSTIMSVQWDAIRENVQNYIRGLNFKYRVAFREKEVNYLNQLGKFVDAHTIEATDKKGSSSLITAARFLICTGGRPAPLDCEGGELAISSDDIFSLPKNPGKTLCVGASYISLECAGFLAGFGNDVTIAVRSILLRGFDRECVDRIGAYMEDHGVKFKRQVVPSKLVRVDDKIQVTFSDGTVDTYDTVLAAVGRLADTDKLGLETVDVKTNPSNRKILATHEQTATPNIYVVGDVMEGCPELTPVAIQAGQLLARRLFGGSKEPMDYVNICTTVFTPIEYACVGLSEEDAKAKFGDDNIEVYIREFMPLEWSLSHHRASHSAFTKVIVDKMPGENVLGIHYVGPNAGEVMQGYGTAMKQGLKFDTLKETVGIHPTSSEEIVTLSITKSSGEDAAAGGC
jgi:thioredoxin reductase (NADPH)